MTPRSGSGRMEIDMAAFCHAGAVLSRLRRYLRAHGLRRTAAEIAHRMIGGEERLIVLVKDLDAIVRPRLRGELRLEDLRASHLPELAELNRKRGQPHADRRFARDLGHGFHGFVCYSRAEIAGYFWWVDRHARVPHPDVRKLGLGIELGEGEVYGSDFFLLEEHRGGGLAGEFLFGVESTLRARGYSRLWGYVASDNRPARWIYSTRGYEPMWLVDRKRALIFRRTTHRPLAEAA